MSAQHALDEPLTKLRQLCLALPGTSERLSHGEPTWFVGDKRVFVMFANHHHDDRLVCWLAAPSDAQRVLIASAPERFFRPPYVGHRGWLGVWLDVSIDWDQLADFVTDAYCMVAPKRLIAALDATAATVPGRSGE